MKLFKKKFSNIDPRFEIIWNEYEELINLIKEKIIICDLFSNKENLNEFIIFLDEFKILIKENLHKLNSNRKKNTELGKNLVDNHLRIIQDLKNTAFHSNDISTLVHSLHLSQDKLMFNFKKMDNINYHHWGITFTGIFLAWVPYYNLLSIGLGGYLLYSSDFRGKISGFIIISLTIFMLITSRLLLMM
ncbi:MAG: hypothetical protein EAX96_13415 [Candidatus Lokiarchaeota archaeon]|nr:hypothetical protein [Candidatus Lokiarchaeota archaeon]